MRQTRSKRKRTAGITFLVFMMVMALFSGTVFAEEDLTPAQQVSFTVDEQGYTANGEWVEMDLAPYIEDGRIMVPVAHASRALGADVEWDPETETVTVLSQEDVISMEIGSPLLMKNDEVWEEMDTTAQIRDIGDGLGRSVLPVSRLARALNVEYEWDDETRTATFLPGVEPEEPVEEPVDEPEEPVEEPVDEPEEPVEEPEPERLEGIIGIFPDENMFVIEGLEPMTDVDVRIMSPDPEREELFSETLTVDERGAIQGELDETIEHETHFLVTKEEKAMDYVTQLIRITDIDVNETITVSGEATPESPVMLVLGNFMPEEQEMYDETIIHTDEGGDWVGELSGDFADDPNAEVRAVKMDEHGSRTITYQMIEE